MNNPGYGAKRATLRLRFEKAPETIEQSSHLAIVAFRSAKEARNFRGAKGDYPA